MDDTNNTVGTMADQEAEQSRLLRKLKEDTAKAQDEQEQVLRSINSDKLTLQDIKSDIALLTNKKRNLEAEVSRLSEVKTELELDLDTKHESRKELDKELGEKTDKIKKLDKEHENLEATIATKTKKAQADIKEDLSKENKELQVLRDEAVTAKAELELLNESLFETAKKIVDLENKHTQMDEEKVAKEAELAQVKEKVADLSKVSMRSESTLISTKTALEAVNSDLGMARKDLETVQKEVERAKNDLGTVKTDTEKAKAEYETVKVKLFSIGNRSKYLDQREAHIKNAFEQAGLKYQPYNPE